MNVTCGSCPAKYAVPDDKVRGKKARIKCKHCGADILVDGTTLGASERPSGSPASATKKPGEAPTATLPPDAAVSLRATAPNAPGQPLVQDSKTKPAAAPSTIASGASAALAGKSPAAATANLGSRQPPPPDAFPAPRATPLGKIQPKTVAVPRGSSTEQRPSDAAPQVIGKQPALASAGAPNASSLGNTGGVTQPQPQAAAKPAGKPIHKMTMVGLAGPAPGSHSPDQAKPIAPPATSASAPPASPAASAAPASPAGPPPKPAIGLAAVRGANQTLLGGTEVPKFEPPAAVAAPPREPSPAAADPSAKAPATQAWTVAFLDGTQREASVTELQQLFATGKISDENLVWQEGMTDWVALRNLPALRKSLMGRSSVKPPPESEPVTQNALDLPGPMSQEPVTAQMVPGEAQTHDGVWKEPGSWTEGGDRPTSQQAPTRLDEEISKALGASIAESEPLDSDAPRPPSQAAPTRPSPLPQSANTAEVLTTAADPSPPGSTKSKSSIPTSTAATTGSGSPRLAAKAEPAIDPSPEAATDRSPRRWPMVLGLLVFAGLGAVVAIYKTQTPTEAFTFLNQTLPAPLRDALGGAPPPPQPVMPTTAAAEPKPAPPEPTPVATAAPIANSEPAASGSATPSGTAPAAAAAPEPPAKGAPGKSQDVAKKLDEPAEKAASEFDEARAQGELSRLSGGIQKCRGTEPPGKGQVRVTFGPSGEASAASIAGQYAASDAGLCVIDIFRQAKVPAFHGEAVTVAHDFALQ